MDFMPQIVGSGLLAIAVAVLLISLRLFKIEKKLDQLIEVLKGDQGERGQGTQGR